MMVVNDNSKYSVVFHSCASLRTYVPIVASMLFVFLDFQTIGSYVYRIIPKIMVVNVLNWKYKNKFIHKYTLAGFNVIII